MAISDSFFFSSEFCHDKGTLAPVIGSDRKRNSPSLVSSYQIDTLIIDRNARGGKLNLNHLDNQESSENLGFHYTDSLLESLNRYAGYQTNFSIPIPEFIWP